MLTFSKDDDKLLEKHKTIWDKIEDFQNIELNVLPINDERYIKNKLKTCGGKAYTIFCDLNVLEDGVECEYFTIISINSLLVYENKYYLQVYLDGCAYKIVDKHMIDLMNIFSILISFLMLVSEFYKCYIAIELI